MGKHLNRQGGFTLIEAVVAITLITLGALALATTFVGAAATNKRVTERQRAIALGRQQIDRMRSLDYGDVALFSTGRSDPDWASDYCPLRDNSGNPRCAEADLILGAGSLPRLADEAVGEDPRDPKTTPQRLASSKACTNGGTICPTVRRNGVILYTYVYWNNWKTTALGKQYKLITVVARFADPKPNLPASQARRYTAVTLTSIVADIPEVGQVR